MMPSLIYNPGSSTFTLHYLHYSEQEPNFSQSQEDPFSKHNAFPQLSAPCNSQNSHHRQNHQME